jgi:transcriptional regulator with XRE-family HTH domain
MSAAVQQALADVSAKGALHGEDIADALSVAPATVARWMRGEAVPDLATRAVIAQLHFIVDRLAQTLAPDGVRRWLHAPLTRGQAPVELIRRGRTAEVLAAIETLDLKSPSI